MVKERQYFHSERKRYLSVNELLRCRKKTKIEVMRTWFFTNYEDPGESLPRDEGEYVYIWGGPYDAQDELYSQFHDVISEEIIEELADELSELSYEWSRIPKYEDTSEYDDYLAETIIKNNEYYENFCKGIYNVKNILEIQVEVSVQEHIYRLMYANLITVMETYLCDAFINTVISDQSYLRRLVETTQEFKDRKISLSDIFKEAEKIEENVKKYLIELVWHRLDKINHLYSNTLGIKFPSDLKNLFKAINKRHDIVHRNGKNNEGKEISISKEDVISLLHEVKTFVDELENLFSNLKQD